MNAALAALVALGVLVAGCAAPAQVGPCGDEPQDAGHIRYTLDASLSGNYTIGNGNVTLLQVADINERPTPATESVRGDLDETGCAWYTLPDGFYHVIVQIPHNEDGERSFFEETPFKLVRDDHQLALGFHNG